MNYKIILRQFVYNCFESTDVAPETKYVIAWKEIQLPFVPFAELAVSLGRQNDWAYIRSVTWIEVYGCFECVCRNEYFPNAFEESVQDKVSEGWSVSKVVNSNE
jgi:hypothetical protein